MVRASLRKGLRHRDPTLEPRLRDLTKNLVVLPCTCNYSDGSHACFQNVQRAWVRTERGVQSFARDTETHAKRLCR